MDEAEWIAANAAWLGRALARPQVRAELLALLGTDGRVVADLEKSARRGSGMPCTPKRCRCAPSRLSPALPVRPPPRKTCRWSSPP